MAILERSDVQISAIDENGFLISTDTDKYSLVRGLLKNLESGGWSLPLKLASEEICEVMASVPPVVFELAFGKIEKDKIIKEDSLPPRYDNKFVIPGSQHPKIGRNKEKMMELVKDIAFRLETLDLTVDIQEETKQESFSYGSPSVVSITMEIIIKSFNLLSSDSELWKNIPEQEREVLILGDVDRFKEIVKQSEFLKRGLTAIGYNLGRKVHDLLELGSLSSIGDLDGRKEARGFLLLLDLYHTFNVQ